MPEDEYKDLSIEQVQAKLSCMPSSSYQSGEQQALLASLQIKSAKKNSESATQYKKTIRWTLIGGIAAIVAAVFAIAQFALSIYQLRNKHEPEKSKMQLQAQDSQLPTKNTSSSSASHTGRDSSINSKKTSTYTDSSMKSKSSNKDGPEGRSEPRP